jgi:hypothetical protein
MFEDKVILLQCEEHLLIGSSFSDEDATEPASVPELETELLGVGSDPLQ